jgi:hypothetical protein
MNGAPDGVPTLRMTAPSMSPPAATEPRVATTRRKCCGAVERAAAGVDGAADVGTGAGEAYATGASASPRTARSTAVTRRARATSSGRPRRSDHQRYGSRMVGRPMSSSKRATRSRVLPSRSVRMKATVHSGSVKLARKYLSVASTSVRSALSASRLISSTKLAPGSKSSRSRRGRILAELSHPATL